MTGDALVGLVVVSHSRTLAQAAVELAGQMVDGEGPAIAVAAGLDDGTLGTDAMAIKDAVERVDGPAGVVVVMDLGSAVLSAELALDLADDPTLRERVTLSPAPLVEGLVAAVVTAAGGAPAEVVAAEAEAALGAKRAQLGAPPSGTAPSDDSAPRTPSGTAPSDDSAPRTPSGTAPSDDSAPGKGAPAGSASGVITVGPKHGLHARPVARLVGELRGLDAQVALTNLDTGAGPAAGTSPTQIALLGALHGHRLRVEATGPDGEEAVRRLSALAARGFGEPTPAPPSGTDEPIGGHDGPGDGGHADRCEGVAAGGEAPLRGVGASPGIVVGPIRHLRVEPPDPATAPPPSGDAATERETLARAIGAVRQRTAALRDATASDVGDAEAGIFEAHLGLLADDALLDGARERIDAGAGAAAAWAAAVDRVHGQVAALPDPYLRARAADLRAVGDQVLRALLGTPGVRPTGTGVLVADDLTPEQAADLDADAVQAIVLAGGSPTSHAAILARARGIPVVVAVGAPVGSLPDGTLVAVDGQAGTVVVRPDEAEVAEHERRRAAQESRRATALAAAGAPATTSDGTVVRVACNVGSLDDARAGAAQGADGSGLVRTELCFVGRQDEPDVEEQEALYLALAQALGGRRMTLRTLDVGGDKPLPYLPVPHEDNPFLGLRGLRLGLAREQVLRRQLTAIARVARQTPVDLLFPMVSTVAELRRAREHLDDVLAAEGVTAGDGPRVGIMVEVPAAALKATAFAGSLDFVSIGTNDLTQYALAAERGNPHVAALSDPLDPGVLALVAAVGRAARGRFDVGVCGEAASDEAAVPVLLGLGVGSLSVTPSAVPSVKQRIRGLDLPACTRLAASALDAESADDVRALVRDGLDRRG